MLLQSCTKDPKNGCRARQDNYFYLTAAQLNQTPYFTNPAFDTISYASDKGDTLTFVKTKTDTTWYKEDGSGSPDCGYDQDFYQTIHNTYTTIKGNGNFDVKLNYKTSTNSLFRLDITFNSKLFWIGNDAIGVKNTNGYLGDLNINGSNYVNVSKASSTTYNIFLNNNFGLLRVEYFIDNINWFYYEK